MLDAPCPRIGVDDALVFRIFDPESITTSGNDENENILQAQCASRDLRAREIGCHIEGDRRYVEVEKEYQRLGEQARLRDGGVARPGDHAAHAIGICFCPDESAAE